MKAIISSRNQDKIREIKKILSDLDLQLLSANEYADLPDVIEDQETLLGNAIKKAKEIAKLTGMATISDDTGLFVEGLNGAPGVRSARYAGDDCSYSKNREKVLSRMQGIENRKAAFRTVVVMALPDSGYTYAEGVLEGIITDHETGNQGFGYDSIFMIPEKGKTLAEMSSEEKNSISHRGKAFRKLADQIKILLSGEAETTFKDAKV